MWCILSNFREDCFVVFLLQYAVFPQSANIGKCGIKREKKNPNGSYVKELLIISLQLNFELILVSRRACLPFANTCVHVGFLAVHLSFPSVLCTWSCANKIFLILQINLKSLNLMSLSHPVCYRGWYMRVECRFYLYFCDFLIGFWNYSDHSMHCHGEPYSNLFPDEFSQNLHKIFIS